MSKRNCRGNYQISEFAVSVFCLIAFVVLPLINLSVIPLRWSLAKSLVGISVQKAAQSETLSRALATTAEQNIPDGLKKIGGITIKTARLALLIESSKVPGQLKTVTKPGSIDKDWLPDGRLGPYIYRLEQNVEAEIAPLILLPLNNPKIPGLTAPLTVQLEDSSAWENLGRDAESGEFFINE